MLKQPKLKVLVVDLAFDPDRLEPELNDLYDSGYNLIHLVPFNKVQGFALTGEPKIVQGFRAILVRPAGRSIRSISETNSAINELIDLQDV
jgi:hypothetical protein